MYVAAHREAERAEPRAIDARLLGEPVDHLSQRRALGSAPADHTPRAQPVPGKIERHHAEPGLAEQLGLGLQIAAFTAAAVREHDGGAVLGRRVVAAQARAAFTGDRDVDEVGYPELTQAQARLSRHRLERASLVAERAIPYPRRPERADDQQQRQPRPAGSRAAHGRRASPCINGRFRRSRPARCPRGRSA
jgi:hypothetical protein